MNETRRFIVDGYIAETSDPHLVELIRHLLSQIETLNRIIRAFVSMTEYISVVANDSPESDETQKS